MTNGAYKRLKNGWGQGRGLKRDEMPVGEFEKF